MSSPVKTGVKTYQNYINGQWTPSSSGATFAVFDPSTEEVIAQVASASSADVDKAVKAFRARSTQHGKTDYRGRVRHRGCGHML